MLLLECSLFALCFTTCWVAVMRDCSHAQEAGAEAMRAILHTKEESLSEPRKAPLAYTSKTEMNIR